jgi:hypothetical protein
MEMKDVLNHVREELRERPGSCFSEILLQNGQARSQRYRGKRGTH